MESIPKDPIFEYTPDTLENVRKIYNLDKPGRMDEAVDLLDAWIKKQEHFLKKDFDRGYLERIIISTKGSIELSKVRMDRLCTMKTLMSEYFGDYDLRRDFKVAVEGMHFVILPKFADNYYRVYIAKGMAKHITSDLFQDYYKYNLILSEYWRARDYLNGFILVMDYTHEDFNLMDFVTKVNPMELHQQITMFVKVYGARLKGIHIVSSSKLVNLMVGLWKPLFGPKLAGRLRVHKTMEELHEFIPKDILPVEYGGKERSLKTLHEKWLDVLSSKEHKEFLKEMRMAAVDESRRPAAKFNDEYLGMPGTFRTLNVD